MRPLSFFLILSAFTLAGCHNCHPITVIPKQSAAPALVGRVYGGNGACYTAQDLMTAFRKCAAKEKICRLEYVK